MAANARMVRLTNHAARGAYITVAISSFGAQHTSEPAHPQGCVQSQPPDKDVARTWDGFDLIVLRCLSVGPSAELSVAWLVRLFARWLAGSLIGRLLVRWSVGRLDNTSHLVGRLGVVVWGGGGGRRAIGV